MKATTYGRGPSAQLTASRPGDVLWLPCSAYVRTMAYRSGKRVDVETCWAVSIRTGKASKVVRVTVLADIPPEAAP